ncbi:MAG TPA: alpha/beta fold hydrolase [Pseudonocardiaceae bacterium]|jgi:pimeloyl-ACP methyl ester carboxylesterase
MSVIGRVVRAAGAVLPVLGLAGAAYQVAGEARDRRRLPPPGELVDVGGRRLHLWREGTGTPAVIVVAALSTACLEWRTVQQQLARDTSVYLYDRAGLGWSNPGPWPRTAERMADELHQLLLAAAVPPPYLLVGHSFGGIIARQFAASHPDVLAGMVLVDSSHENQNRRLSPYLKRDRLTLWYRAARHQFTPLGIVRAATDLGITTQPRHDAEQVSPPGLADVALALYRTSRYRRAAVQELLGFASGIAAGVPPPLGGLPLTVLTAGPAGREHWYPAWLQMQHELAALSSRSTHLIAGHAGHHIHHDDPDFVIRALRDAIQRATAE